MICTKEHRYNEIFKDLPFSQGGDGRHKCAGCAYEIGYMDGFNSGVKQSIFELDLPFSQAGYIRHKDTQSAYDLGYSKGLKDKAVIFDN